MSNNLTLKKLIKLILLLNNPKLVFDYIRTVAVESNYNSNSKFLSVRLYEDSSGYVDFSIKINNWTYIFKAPEIEKVYEILYRVDKIKSFI